MAVISISNILKTVSEQKTFDERVQALQYFDNITLRVILRLALDPTVKWLLPEGDPPYKENEYDNQEGNLYNYLKKMYIFIEGGIPALSKVKREQLFIQMCEYLDKNDAKLMCAVKDKKLPYKNLTVNLVNRAFPGLLTNVDDNRES